MNGIRGLLLGILGTFAFSWVGLIFVPNLQIGHLDPQMDEEGNDVYPAPKSGMAERGRRVYVANGCVYCHSQQVRADYAASDLERKWGERRSAPRDYLFDQPSQLGKMRMGPDLANVGKRGPVEDENAAPPTGGASPAAVSAPAAANSPKAGTPAVPAPGAAVPAPGNPTLAAAVLTDTPAGPGGAPTRYTARWHHQHLYSPRSINLDSNMPSYAFLYEKRKVDAQFAADALKLSGADAPPEGSQIVPTYDAKCLVAYLMSLDQSHPLKEVKSAAIAAPSAPGKGGK